MISEMIVISFILYAFRIDNELKLTNFHTMYTVFVLIDMQSVSAYFFLSIGNQYYPKSMVFHEPTIKNILFCMFNIK